MVYLLPEIAEPRDRRQEDHAFSLPPIVFIHLGLDKKNGSIFSILVLTKNISF